ncbi:NEL-type E3 ubiquitin ligase domain-containing protein [Pseudomonas yamanorum]|uniref:NEL-type E3 ubiquitin ligase domain-containing protein n=1 Tax=Pseudomonas yamanorum TaxID=515393 RepID=UPI003B9F75B1
MADTPDQSLHHAFIENALPHWLKTTSPHRLRALNDVARQGIRHYPHASAEQHQALKPAIAEHWQQQTAMDQRFQALTDVYAFAEPLLKNALKAYGDIDVKTTYLRLYASATVAWWVHDFTRGEQSKTLSLLDAALANFAAPDTFLDYAFLSAEDPRGQRDTLTLRHTTTGAVLTAEQFKQICRTLDLGARYQKSLRQALGFYDATVTRAVRLQMIATQKTALGTAAHLALINRDIDADAHGAVLDLIAGHVALLDGLALECHTLSLMNTALTGILLLFVPQPNRPVGKVLVYIPADPEHPLKQYPSPAAFLSHLTEKLRDKQRYQTFFSQFIDHARRGEFFAGLNSRLSRVRWHQTPATDPRPSWRDTPITQPNLQFSLLAIGDDHVNRSTLAAENDLWNYQYRLKLNKIVNDALDIAVPTATAHRHARWAWWDNLEKILGDIFNAALLVLTPFVPLLGEAMLAYSLYQITDEVFEGIVDWAQGRGAEAAEQVVAVADSVIQFALFGAASQLGHVARLKLSPFVEGLRPVVRPDGSKRLWHPDIAPYAVKNLDQPPIVDGLHTHQGKQILALEGAHFEVQADAETGDTRIAHPERANAYQPQVQFNGSGAFVHEAEQPRTWDSTTLMRRLGPRTAPFTDDQLQRMQRISGTDDGVLRNLYVRNQPTPPLLDATLNRYEAYQAATQSVDTIRSGAPLPLDPVSGWFEQIVTELPGWPQDKALEVFVRSDKTGSSHKHANPDASPANTLQLSLAEVMSGELPARVIAFLDEPSILQLLGGDVPPDQRVQTLRDQLADSVARQTGDIADYIHNVRQLSADPHVRQLRGQVNPLDRPLAETLLAAATPAERQTLDQRVPLRLLNQARELSFAEDSAKAYAGFFAPWPISEGTERLVLNTLKRHSNGFGDLHLQIRDREVSGAVRCEAGPADASRRRVLVRQNHVGYELFDEQGLHLHGPDTLYEGLLHALSETQQRELGYRPGQGAGLKRWLMETLEPLAERRRVLAEPPLRSTADVQTTTLLGGAALGRLRHAREQLSNAHARSVLENLFPTLDEARLERFLNEIGPGPNNEILNRLVLQRQALQTELEHWKRLPGTYPKNSVQAREEKLRKHHLAQKIYRCWADRLAVHYDDWGQLQSGASLDLSGLELPGRLPMLGDGFAHVTRLKLANCMLDDSQWPFLQAFPSLRELDLSANTLTRLPEPIASMRHLRDLNLGENQLPLHGADLARLKNLRHLRNLNLYRNPLTQPPNVSKMPNLRRLFLSRTPITEWPVGLFAQPREEGFLLDLSQTQIDHVPTVTPGSAEARTVAHTRLNRNTLRNDQRLVFEQYREAAGLDPNRSYEPRGESAPWLENTEQPLRGHREQLWQAVEREHGSQGLFEVIKALETPDAFNTAEDRQAYWSNQHDLQERVWRVLGAAHNDTALREKLFMMTSFPGLCADGSAQIFNDLGIEVMVNEAERYSGSPDQREGSLVTLAKGTARLKQLNRIAAQDIAHRLTPRDQGGLGQRLRSQLREGVAGEVDDVEIYLAYQTRLANRLDLPWVSEHMLYRDVARVETAQIEQAYTTVLGMGEGDGLVNQMLLERFWEQHLEATYPRAFEANNEHFADQLDLLDALREAQSRVAEAEAEGLPVAQRELLKMTLQGLADTLNVPHEQVLTGQAMTDETYDRMLNDLGYRRQQWLRDLTHQALERHGERRNRN